VFCYLKLFIDTMVFVTLRCILVKNLLTSSLHPFLQATAMDAYVQSPTVDPVVYALFLSNKVFFSRTVRYMSHML